MRADPHQQNTIIAKHGVLLPDPHSKRDSRCGLYDGSVFGVEFEAPDATHVTSFQKFTISEREFRSRRSASTTRIPGEMTYPQLRTADRGGRASTGKARL